MWSPVACSSCGAGTGSFELFACATYSRVTPVASRRSSSFARFNVYDWKSWKAMTAATKPLTTIPARKSAGSRKRSDLSIARPLGVHGVACGPDLVADAPHGHDRRRVAELAAQLADMDVHGARVAGQ